MFGLCAWFFSTGKSIEMYHIFFRKLRGFAKGYREDYPFVQTDIHIVIKGTYVGGKLAELSYSNR